MIDVQNKLAAMFKSKKKNITIQKGNFESGFSIARHKYGKFFPAVMFIVIVGGAIYIPLRTLSLLKLNDAREGANAAVTTIYVRKNGTDNASCGSTASPCRTWAYALNSRMSEGNVLKVGPGTWDQADLNPTYPSEPFCTGKPGRNIPNGTTIESENGAATTIVNAYARPMTSLSINDCPPFITIRADAHDITIRGFTINGGNADRPTIQNSSDNMNQGSEYYVIGLYGYQSTAPKNITLDQLSIHDCMISCTYISGSGTVNAAKPTNVVISNSTYEHCGDRRFNLGGCLYLKGAISPVIDSNTFSDAHNSAVQFYADLVIEGKTQYGSDFTYTRNTTTLSGRRTDDVLGDAGGGGALFMQGYFGNNLVANNVFIDNYGSGIEWGAPAADALIYHNTLKGNSSAKNGTKYQVLSDTQASPSFSNNIVVGAIHKAGGTWTGTNNIITGGITQATVDRFGNIVPVGAANLTNTSTISPTFISSSNLHLSSGSAGINAASVSTITQDLDGAARPVGSAPDIGAYEYGATVTSTPTPTPVTTPLPTSTPVVITTNTPVSTLPAGCYRFEAENMTRYANGPDTANATAVAGYSGTGYKSWTTQLAALDFNKVSGLGGAYRATIRYNAPTTATRLLYHNYPNQQPVAFTLPATSTNIWTTATQDISLTASVALLSFSYNSTNTGTVNLDYLDLCPVSIPTPTPTIVVPTPTPVTPTTTTLPTNPGNPVDVVPTTPDPPSPSTPPVVVDDHVILKPGDNAPVVITKPDGTKETLATAPPKETVEKVITTVDGKVVPTSQIDPYQLDTTLLTNGEHIVTQTTHYKDGSTSSQSAKILVSNKQNILSPVIRFIRLNKKGFITGSSVTSFFSLGGGVYIIAKRKYQIDLFRRFHGF